MVNSLDVMQAIKRLVRFPSRGSQPVYAYRPGDSVVEDFAEFSQLPAEEVSTRINDYHRLCAEDWHRLDGHSFAQRAGEYYENSESFIYGILAANPRPQAVVEKLNRFNPAILKSIANHGGRRLLEFGGGIGVFCEIATRLGKEVHYLDVPGIAFRFALWRFQKLGLKVTTIEASSGTIHIPDRYDIVYTDAVLEHLPPDLQRDATRAIGNAVGNEGLLIFLVDLGGPTADDPMHHEVDIGALHNLLDDCGLACETGRDTFCSVWRRAEGPATTAG